MEPVLERVTQDWPKRPFWGFRKTVSKDRITRQMLYALHGRRVALGYGAELSAAAAAGADAGSVGVRMRMAAALGRAENDFTDLEAAAAGSEEFETRAARISAGILKDDLGPFWHKSGIDDILRNTAGGAETAEQQFTRFGGDFVALQFCRYMIYCVVGMRLTAVSISLNFMLLLFLSNSYSPQAPQVIARLLAVLFVGAGWMVAWVFARLERDPFLSRIAGSKPGELNTQFWIQLVTLGGLPLLGVVAHLFPAVSQFLFQWVAPGVQAMR